MLFIGQFKNLFKRKPHCSLCHSEKGYLPLSNYYFEHWKRYGFTGYRAAETLALTSYSCSQCGASDRERFYAYWIFNMIRERKLTPEAKVIHFSPEPVLSKSLYSCFKYYLTADYLSDEADLKINIEEISLENNSIDFFICSHVLEHIGNDAMAVKELYRITKPGGMGILMAPIILSLSTTLEEITPLSKEERWRIFGQDDHVRVYARNGYLNLIKKSGFHIQEFGKKEIGVSVFKKLGLSDSSVLYVVRK